MTAFRSLGAALLQNEDVFLVYDLLTLKYKVVILELSFLVFEGEGNS